MAHLFISYSRRDEDARHELTAALENAGHSVWWDTRSIQTGADWLRAISTAIVDSDAVVLLLSQSASASTWVRHELETARRTHKAILPIRIDAIAPEDFPATIRDEHVQVLDGLDDRSAAFARLLHDLRAFHDQGPRLPFALPHPRVAEFVGREEPLREVHRLLCERKGAGRSRVVVSGMSGIGKTQLCIEYVHRYRYFYPDGVLYLDAQANLNEQLVRLADALGIRGDGPSRQDDRVALAEAVTHHLRGLRRALLLLDNVSSLRALRQERIGHSTAIVALPFPILLNSRAQCDAADVDRIDLGPLSDTEAAVVLFRRRPELRDRPDTAALLRALGGVPLALALAAAFLAKKTGATPSSYLTELATHGWEAVLSLVHLKPGDIEAYGEVSFVPALKAQWALLDLDSSRALLAAAALHPPNTLIPAGRLGFLAGLTDIPGGMRTDLSDAVHEAVATSLASEAGSSQLMLHAATHDFIRRHAFADFEQERDRCGNRVLGRLQAFASFAGLFAVRGCDSLTTDLLTIRAMFASSIEIDSWCADWLAIVLGHPHVFRELPSASIVDFAQHVLLLSQIRMRRRIASMARQALAASGFGFFDVEWTSWQMPMQLRTRLLAEGGKVSHLALASSAAWAIGHTAAGILHVWELPSGELQSKIVAGTVRWLTTSPSGNRVALLDSGELRIFALPTLHLEMSVACSVSMNAVEFAREDLLVGIYGEGERLIILEPDTGSERTLEVGPLDPIEAIFRLRDNEVILGLQHGGFALIDVARAAIVTRGRFDQDNVSLLAACTDGDDVLVCTTAGVFRVRESDGNVVCVNDRVGKWYSRACFVGGGRYGVFVGHRNALSIVDLSRPDDVVSLPSPTHDDIVAGAGNAAIVVAGNSHFGELYLWDFGDGIPQTVEKAHSREIVEILTVGNRSSFVTTSMDWTAALWNRATGVKVRAYGGGFPYGYAKGLAKTVADDRFLVGYTFTMALYDVASGDELHSLRPPCDGVTAIGMAPSGRFFVTGSSDGVLLLWSEHGEVLGNWQVDEHEICSVQVSSDEKTIAGGTTAGTLFVVPTGTWRLQQWPGARGIVSSVCLSSDSAWLWAAHGNGDVCGWSTDRGELTVTLAAHNDRVSCVRLVAEGRLLITSSHDGSIRVWSTRRRESLHVLQLGQPVGCFDYDEQDGRLLVGLSAGDVLALTRVGPLVASELTPKLSRLGG
jgi:WD40 repeat protein